MELKNMLKKFFLFYIILIYSKNIKNACLKEICGKVNKENSVNICKDLLVLGVPFIGMYFFREGVAWLLKGRHHSTVKEKDNKVDQDVCVFQRLFKLYLEKIKKKASKDSSIEEDNCDFDFSEGEKKIIQEIMAKMSTFDLFALKEKSSKAEILEQYFKIKSIELIIGMALLLGIGALCGIKEKIFNGEFFVCIIFFEVMSIVVDILFIYKKTAEVEKISSESDESTMEEFLNKFNSIFGKGYLGYIARAVYFLESCVLLYKIVEKKV